MLRLAALRRRRFRLKSRGDVGRAASGLRPGRGRCALLLLSPATAASQHAKMIALEMVIAVSSGSHRCDKEHPEHFYHSGVWAE